MTIRTGQLIPGTLKKAADGINNAHVCSVMLEGEIVRAYVKPIPWPKAIVECFCALLLQRWGLDVPEPILVEINGAAWFGSLDAAYPSLYRRFFLHEEDSPWHQQRLQAALVAAMSLPDTPLAMACDEAIANHDRNLGNILWDGQHTVWIDHENAIQLPRSPDHNVNKLAKMACEALNDFIDIQQAAMEAARQLKASGADIDLAAAEVDNADGCATITKYRLKNLVDRVLDRFPKPDDLFGH